MLPWVPCYNLLRNTPDPDYNISPSQITIILTPFVRHTLLCQPVGEILKSTHSPNVAAGMGSQGGCSSFMDKTHLESLTEQSHALTTRPKRKHLHSELAGFQPNQMGQIRNHGRIPRP